MYAPFVHAFEWSTYTNYVVAFIIGIGFGVSLEQGGFGNGRKLALTFYLRDLTVIKVMFMGVIVAMIGIIVLHQFGVLDTEQMWINPTYIWPGIIGGLIMGAGFVIGGYCPGTGMVAMVTMKLDALVNILGALFGMVVAAEVLPGIWDWWNSSLVGTRITLPEYFGMSEGLVGFLVIIGAMALFAGSEFAEKKFGETEEES